MKKLQSKRGFTLVELVVTIAILSMVAGMGVGIVGQALRNYSTAQVTSVEQETALSVETFILDAARISASVQASTAGSVPNNTVTGFYIKMNSDGTLQTIRNELGVKPEDPPVVTYLSYKGVDSVSVQVKKQKPTELDNFSSQCFLFMEYTIKMQEGYTLKGSVVMNNADSDVSMAAGESPFVDESEVIRIDAAHTSDAIAIIQ